MLNWLLNIENKQATYQKRGYRFIQPKSMPLNVVPIVEEVSKKILNHQVDHRIKWGKNDTVCLLMKEMISTGSPSTLCHRRRKIREKVNEILLPLGWQKISDDLYAPPETKIKKIPQNAMKNKP